MTGPYHSDDLTVIGNSHPYVFNSDLLPALLDSTASTIFKEDEAPPNYGQANQDSMDEYEPY